ncbi:Rec8 like protein-domain-containing protein [Lasiosphaeria miniovina]|uniref:Rec8 like protein-domain-containing protein n=1 Tax=Lasiosphaeria miniovina TaxID=1954250 RepID=A0AA40AJT9_9PEZI|nr:Rec8 like protein-domain-containing protein [Lasiosphaeria miniovina]KAK0717161.1 Rec8 like protein-domain-containing protein [Lasiosphaeria miniovina]
MFWSHEILTSRQHGVATVWLVSTIGFRSAHRKISRKAIQEVDVQKACETILQPGAPIALRLQGSLLYGVSRVYSQQCTYVLTDAEKVQTTMRTLYGVLGGDENALDPQAGKAKRDQITLPNDPNFDLTIKLPAFHFDGDGNLIPPHESQASGKTSSQFSPMQLDHSSPGGGASFIGRLDLPPSPFRQGSSQLLSPFGLGSAISQQKDPENNLVHLRDDEEELQVVDDWGIEIDAEGNVMEIVEEPELPQLPRPEGAHRDNHIHEDEEPFLVIDDQGDVVMAIDAAEAVLPHAEATHPQPEGIELQLAEEYDLSSERARVSAQKRRRRALLAPDHETQLSRQEIKSWSAEYLATAETKRARRARHRTTAADARVNAFQYVFGRGVANVGSPTGIPDFSHPLARIFAGNSLQTVLLSSIVEEEDEYEAPRGRRRSALEALELEGEDEERRVRRRISEDAELQAGQGVQRGAVLGSDGHLIIDPEEEREVGREAGSNLPDLPSEVPWNRHSSQVPSSSVKGGGRSKLGHSASGRQVSASPLRNRGNTLLPEIERFSDSQPAYESDGVGPAFHSANTFSDPIIESMGSQDRQKKNQGEANTSQVTQDTLDHEGLNFVGFVQAVALDKGDADDNDTDEDDNTGGTDRRKWVGFEELFEPADQKRAVVAQAFYQVLSLATKNIIKVRQEGEINVPFGPIHVGVTMPPIDE